MKLTRSQWIKIVDRTRRGSDGQRLRQEEGRTTAAAAAATAPAPTASLTANPNTINAGQSTTLTWKTDYATDVSIDQLGKVDPSGSRTVIPSESTTYHLVAKNDSGTQEATARVTVTRASATAAAARTQRDRSTVVRLER